MTKPLKLKYIGCSVVFQEVPDEVSLTINISGCPVHCQGCHSQYLWEYIGNYISDDIESLIAKYDGMITCVCFMGGDQNLGELQTLCEISRGKGYKTCLYTGNNISDTLRRFALSNLNYLKVGNYQEKYGGLNSKITNQRMYKIDGVSLVDITHLFQERKLNATNT